MRLKKLSILLKSSTSISRFARVLFAVCQRWIYHDKYSAMSKKTHHKEDPDPGEDDCGRGECLKIHVRVMTSNEANCCSSLSQRPGQGWQKAR